MRDLLLHTSFLTARYVVEIPASDMVQVGRYNVDVTYHDKGHIKIDDWILLKETVPFDHFIKIELNDDAIRNQNGWLEYSENIYMLFDEKYTDAAMLWKLSQ